MADDADQAQANHELFVEQGMLARRKARAEAMKVENLPICFSCEENKVMVSPKGTIFRICSQCFNEDRKVLNDNK